MSDLVGKQRYVLLTKHGILVRPDQKKTILGYGERRGVSVNQTMRDLIDFGVARGFFLGILPTHENIPSEERSS